MDLKALAKEYHSAFPKGKIATQVTKKCDSQQDLSLAYTPGIGEICKQITEDPQNVWEYTGKANTIAIISDGTAVLGFGDIGPLAALPVMEGKLVLFKKFANIDGYPLCLKMAPTESEDQYIERFLEIVKPLEPSLGGINLEDISAPKCFEIERRLDEALEIPVFHDDQDGTAIVLIAGLINALKLVNKKVDQIKVVINGAGAAGIAIGKMLENYNVPKEKIFMCDSKGLITQGRTDLNDYKKMFAQEGEMMELAEVVAGADVFIGVSVAGALKPEMVKTMAPDSIIFAMANPVPEIMPEEAFAAGAKIVGTGRSDFPNQVNNALCFPGLFRAALDTRSKITHKMKLAAAEAIASLVGEPLDKSALEMLEKAYPQDAAKGIFTENKLRADYVIPKQFDPRVVPRVAKYVAQAAMDNGTAKIKIADLEGYEKKLLEGFGE